MAQITLNSSGVASNGSLLLQSNGTTTAVTVDASQNVGIGVTPSAWSASFYKVIEGGDGNNQSAIAFRTDTNGVDLFSNAYFNGTTSIYKYTGTAGFYQLTGNTHAWFAAPSGTAGNAITFTQAMTLDASGRLGIGQTSPQHPLHITGASGVNSYAHFTNATTGNTSTDGFSIGVFAGASDAYILQRESANLFFYTNSLERAAITAGGNLLVGKSSRAFATAGVDLSPTADSHFVASGIIAAFNRLDTDGILIEFAQAGTIEGSISVSGTTVSYNGGHLSRWAQTTTAKDNSLVKGTVLSNLDEMNVYTDAEGNPVPNEQLNKVKVSNTEGDANVAGVFVNWSHDEDHNVDEINMAMTGDMIIRIAQGTTVQRGDLLMSAGDGTAKPQGDDIVRSKTVAKVTSTHVTCTYADGSYCVPCVLMAC
jgi:hypothetical protein